MSTVFLSANAISRGIQEVTFERETDYGAAVVRFPDSPSFTSYFTKGKWHRTRVEARAKAEAMRDRRIKALERQIERLKAMTFA